MRAATFTDYGEPLAVEEIDDPEPGPDGVVVEVEACGVCRSDWHAWRGDWSDAFEPGHVFGHEPAGHVVEVGDDVATVTEGEHVTVPSTSPTVAATSSGTADRTSVSTG